MKFNNSFIYIVIVWISQKFIFEISTEMTHACPFCEVSLTSQNFMSHIKSMHSLQNREQCNCCHCHNSLSNIYNYFKHLQKDHSCPNIVPNKLILTSNISQQVPIFRKRKTFQAECEETPFAKEYKTANSGKLAEIAVPSNFSNNDVSCSNIKPRSGGTIEFPQEQSMNINSVLSITSASKKKIRYSHKLTYHIV